MFNTRAFIEKIARHIWVSYWFIPALILLISLLMVPTTLALDRLLADSVEFDFILLIKTQPDSAQALLSTIAGSIIGIAGVSFSITIVAVSFASGAFGPRSIGNFMRDRGNQTCLGVFIGPFLYALLILGAVQSGGEVTTSNQAISEFVPHLSISVSVGLVIICVFSFIYFIHHVPETINIERIIARLGDALKNEVSARFPNLDTERETPSGIDPNWVETVDTEKMVDIKYVAEGYVQAIDMHTLRRLADDNGLLIKIVKRPGAFVTTHSTIMCVYADSECNNTLKKELSACVATGDVRTINQNVEFIADQLIEIIARALSPGVNDPFSAIACLNWLQVGILAFAETDEGDKKESVGRLYAAPLQFDEFVTAIFEKAIPYIWSDENVTRHTRMILSFIEKEMESDTHIKAISKALKKLDSRTHID